MKGTQTRVSCVAWGKAREVSEIETETLFSVPRFLSSSQKEFRKTK
jgi:hypothetical protein